MRISFNQLKKFVDFTYNPDQLAEKLTEIGIEVKEMQRVGTLERVVVGQILAVKKHPNADRLKIVDVDIGKDKLSLVCGAPNVDTGKFIAVALVDAELPGGMRVKKSKIRGVESPGMICSERDLGLGEDHAGIIALSTPLRIGECFSRALELEDTIFDVEITSNRGDWLSILGIAREIAAVTGETLQLPPFGIQSECAMFENNPPSIQIQAPTLCPFYAARIIRGVRVASSPLWLAWKIILSGAKPINNVVDVTNYVMWEIGQPLHPFDLEMIRSPKIIIREAEKGEVLVTLDDKTRQLNESMLVIADNKVPIAIAGIMGGKETEVTTDTNNILLEAAYFSPVSIGRTSRELGLKSEACSRFERGIDAAMVEKAMDRASMLIQAVAGGKIVEPSLQAGELPLRKNKICFRPSRVKRITNLGIAASNSEKILRNLGFELDTDVDEEKDTWRVTIPSFRSDVQREIDLVEDIVRIHSYEKIGTSLPELGSGGGKDAEGEKIEHISRNILKGFGFYEVITNPLIGESLLQVFREPLNNVLNIRNPLSIQQKFLRPYLFCQLVDIASFNYNQEPRDLRLMQTGKTFIKNKESSSENTGLCALVVENGFDFYTLKGIVEVILAELGIGEVKFFPCSHSYFSIPEAAFAKKDEQTMGYLGKLHSEICTDFKLPVQTYFFELNLDLLTHFCNEKVEYCPLPKFPSAKRDLSIVIQNSVLAEEIKEVIASKASHVETIDFFDSYQGPGIPEGCKSISFSLIFRHSTKTLTDREVDYFQDEIVKSLQSKWGARLRDR